MSNKLDEKLFVCLPAITEEDAKLVGAIYRNGFWYGCEKLLDMFERVDIDMRNDDVYKSNIVNLLNGKLSMDQNGQYHVYIFNKKMYFEYYFSPRNTFFEMASEQLMFNVFGYIDTFPIESPNKISNEIAVKQAKYDKIQAQIAEPAKI